MAYIGYDPGKSARNLAEQAPPTYLHVISLRKANQREQQGYEKAQARGNADDP